MACGGCCVYHVYRAVYSMYDVVSYNVVVCVWCRNVKNMKSAAKTRNSVHRAMKKEWSGRWDRASCPTALPSISQTNLFCPACIVVQEMRKNWKQMISCYKCKVKENTYARMYVCMSYCIPCFSRKIIFIKNYNPVEKASAWWKNGREKCCRISPHHIKRVATNHKNCAFWW